jgi:hypothetical protein
MFDLRFTGKQDISQWVALAEAPPQCSESKNRGFPRPSHIWEALAVPDEKSAENQFKRAGLSNWANRWWETSSRHIFS